MILNYKKFISINERRLIDISDTEIYTKEFIDNYIKENDYLLTDYIERNDLDEDDTDEILKSYDFRNDIIADINDNYYEFCQDMELYISADDKIKLYRMITTDENWLNHLKKDGKHLGIYWSYEENAAQAHWADVGKHNDALITIEIKQDYIDWIDTIHQNIDNTYKEEKEIRLYKNTKIKILELKINGEPVDISDIKNKIFYA